MTLICSYCSTTLPAGAMFCGECGRAIAPSTAPLRAKAPSSSQLARPRPDTSQAPAASPTGSAGNCQQCSAPLSADDIFCGECGFVVISATGSFARQSATGVVVLPQRAVQVEVETEPASEPEAQPEPEAEPEPGAQSKPEAQSEPAVKSEPQVLLPHADARQPIGERFVLQFSTGESFTVTGSGLIGRNPRAEPGEYFDQIVRIIDPSRSVSKTHLEFGQEDGGFWVKDRFSGNGTVVRAPESSPQRCHPDRRYRLVRGSRVDMGEQFFVLS